MKRILSLVLAMALVFGLGAGALAQDGSLDAIKQNGKLVLGLDDSFPPMGFRDENNDIVGFDIDLAREVCARLGVELVPQRIDWDTKEMELNNGNIDCIWNGMSRTPAREESMALSLNYMNNKIVLLVNQPGYGKKEDLAGKILAVQAKSFAEEVVNDAKYADYKASLAEVRAYPDYVTAIMDMQNGNVDAIAVDLVVANFQMNNLKDEKLRVIDNLEDDLFCIGFRKADAALRDAVNEALTAMQKDGTVDKIAQQWFGENISIIPAE